MVAIHISGTSGSGKSTLGSELKNKFRQFHVIETDRFVTVADRQKRDKLETEKEKRQFIHKIYQEKFDYYIGKYKYIIFVGILDSSVSDGTVYKGHNKKFDLKIYLNVSPKDLIRRYYTREVVKGILSADRYLRMAAKGEWYIQSSTEIIKYHKLRIKEHQKMGYQLMSGKQIEKLIKKVTHEK